MDSHKNTIRRRLSSFYKTCRKITETGGSALEISMTLSMRIRNGKEQHNYEPTISGET